MRAENADLKAQLAEKDTEIEENTTQIEDLRVANEALVARLDRLEELMRQ